MVVFDSVCPVCHSLNWSVAGSSQDAGSSYSFAKGAAGAVLLGPIGAVAGIGGKKHASTTFVCKDCGYSKTYTYKK